MIKDDTESEVDRWNLRNAENYFGFISIGFLFGIYGKFCAERRIPLPW